MENNLNQLHEKIIEIFKENIPEEIEGEINTEITLETTLDELNLSSIDFIKIVVELEEAFDLEFENEMLLYEAFTDITSVSEYIIRKQSN